MRVAHYDALFKRNYYYLALTISPSIFPRQSHSGVLHLQALQLFQRIFFPLLMFDQAWVEA